MISCEKHDYVEIACLYRLPVELILDDGSKVSGTATDVRNNDSRQECLQLDSRGQLSLIVLDNVRQMTALKDNPHFDTVHLS
ncbi:Rho-binding antiterminator [Maricurvus nonylphenolicus]|uniref:Rho-binding antiterminator n=1 Tax=Maricurvus nonylphenolicus TaxID=1008307 RepID=UPI0036F1A2B9